MTDSDRRKFLINTGAASLSLGFRRLAFTVPGIGAIGVMSNAALAAPAYTGWQDVFRKKWSWDHTVKGSHDCNCTNSCSWTIYVRNGMVWREEQTATYDKAIPGLTDFNPQGCQKGATYSNQMYAPTRLKYPLKRVGERGSGKWQRISWDQTTTEIAQKLIEIIRDDGHDTILTSQGTQAQYACKGGPAKWRFTDMVGGVLMDTVGDIADGHVGSMLTHGLNESDGGSDTQLYSKCIISWVFNHAVTSIPNSHHTQEARYNGATIISISPDQNPTHMHADIWVNPKQGTDVALALAMAHIIVKQKLYDAAHLKEQTDLPFLVIEGTQKYLRESDMVAGGSDQIFYLWDSKTGRAVAAPGSMGSKQRTIALGALDPALEGRFNVTLAEGRSVKVTTVFELLKPILEHHSPEYAQQITGVGVDTIKRITHEYATRSPALILAGWGMGKLYHGDLLERSLILLAALTGNIGKDGGGFWGGGIMFVEGIFGLMKTAMTTGKMRIVPSTFVYYTHSPGMREAMSRWSQVPEGKKSADDYIMESIRKGWIPVSPPPGRTPRALIECGSNMLSRVRMNQILKRDWWPQLKLILAIDVRMSSTALQSDYVLPAAGYYETEGIRYSYTRVPYHTYRGKAVQPLGESHDEWWIFAMICKKIQQLAPGMGITSYKDLDFGFERNLGTLYDEFTEHGKWPEDVDDSVLLKQLMDTTQTFKDIPLKEFKERGHVPWPNSGLKDEGMVKLYGATSDYEPGKPFTAMTDFTEKKQPWRTLTGRQQFYIDHDWFIEFGEQLPVYKEAPAMGGNHPLRITHGHTRWSIHSAWRENKLMLRQQRGEPLAYINPRDAAARGIVDNELVEVFNDISSFRVRVMVTPSMQVGQVHMYHAWEPYQYDQQVGASSVLASQIKPIHCVGNYGHLTFSPIGWQPNMVDKGTRVDVRKI